LFQPSHLFIDTGDATIEVAEEPILSPRTAALFDNFSAPKATSHSFLDDGWLSPIAQHPSRSDSESTGRDDNGNKSVFDWKSLANNAAGGISTPTPSPMLTTNNNDNDNKANDNNDVTNDDDYDDAALRELARYVGANTAEPAEHGDLAELTDYVGVDAIASTDGALARGVPVIEVSPRARKLSVYLSAATSVDLLGNRGEFVSSATNISFRFLFPFCLFVCV
jgi:hypothetical protein